MYFKGFESFSSTIETLAIAKQMAVPLELLQVFSSVIFLGVLGIHCVCLDSSQTKVGLEGAKIFTLFKELKVNHQ